MQRQTKQCIGKQFWFIPNAVGGSPRLSLEIVLKLTQSCYVNLNIFFVKTGSLIIY